MGNAWNTLKRCVKLYNGIFKDKERATEGKAGWSTSKGKRQAKKIVSSEQQPIKPADPLMSYAPPPFQLHFELPPP